MVQDFNQAASSAQASAAEQAQFITDVENANKDGVLGFLQRYPACVDTTVFNTSSPGTIYSYSALSQAALTGNVEIAALLLDHGADVNKPVGGDLPLIIAIDAFDNKPAIVSLLLSRGAKIDAKNAEGETAESLAVRQELDDIVQIIRKERIARDVADACRGGLAQPIENPPPLVLKKRR